MRYKIHALPKNSERVACGLADSDVLYSSNNIDNITCKNCIKKVEEELDVKL